MTHLRLDTLLLLLSLSVALACSGDDGGEADAGTSAGCSIDCDCPQGDACVDGVCTATASPNYCCENAGCPSGAACVTAAGTRDVCAECVVDCDCPQGEACSTAGRCVATLEPTWCCENDGCPSGEACVDSVGAVSVCGACAGPCDCPQGEACTASGFCIATAEPTWCCANAGCPAGDECVEPSGAVGICGGTELDGGSAERDGGPSERDGGPAELDGGPVERDAGVDGGPVERDAGYDAGHDAGYDAGHDAGYDAGHDAGYDAGHDAGYDAGYDAGHDAGYDAGHDAGHDSGTPGGEVDILFVIDDSGSMDQEQMALATAFADIVADLYALSSSFRIGVTTTGRDLTVLLNTPLGVIPQTEMGPGGALLQPTGCGMSDPWIDASDPDVATTFACLASVGTMGSGYEMPFYTTELALTDRIGDGSNVGFLRPGAHLAIIVLTDEDDCSIEGDITLEADIFGGGTTSNPCEYGGMDLLPHTRLQGVLDATRPRDWSMTFIAGPGPDGCMSTLGEATYAHRLEDFVAARPEPSDFESICVGELRGPLRRTLAAIHARL